jgi:hypothetical protein
VAAPGTALTRWQRGQHLLVVFSLALAAAVAAAIFAEGRYARRLCESYGRERQLTYVRFQYPPANPIGVLRADHSCSCIFSNESATTVDVDFKNVAPNYQTYLFVTLATTFGATVPIFVVVFLFGLVQVYGALGIAPGRNITQAQDPPG